MDNVVLGFGIIACALLLMLFLRLRYGPRVAREHGGQSWEQAGAIALIFDHPKGLDPKAQQQLYLAAHYSVVSELPVDLLLNEQIDSPQERESWQSSWDVHDHDSATQSLEWLLTAGHRGDLQEVLGKYNAAPPDSVEPSDKGPFGLLRSAQARLNISAPLPPIGAWDYARVANNTRAFLSLKYISMEEARHFLGRAHELATRDYDNWQEYSVGFLLGRLLWSEEFHPQFFDVHEMLMNDPESPYLTTELG